LTDFLDLAALELTSAITLAAKASISIIKPGARPKSWWNPELLDLRKAMLQDQRKMSQDPASKQLYLRVKNSYFLAIKRAK
jgi:hypothetical protein